MEAVEDFLKSNIIYSLLIVFLIFYGPRLAPRLSDWVLVYFKHPLFRFLVIFVLLYMASRHLTDDVKGKLQGDGRIVLIVIVITTILIKIQLTLLTKFTTKISNYSITIKLIPTYF